MEQDPKELFAFVGEDRQGDYGLVMGMMPLLGPMLLVCVKRKNVDGLLPMAQEAADTRGKPVRIIRFTAGEQIGEVTPRGGAR